MTQSSPFDLLNDDTLSKILEFLGVKTYSTFGRISKKCNYIFTNLKQTKESFIGFLPISTLKLHEKDGFQAYEKSGIDSNNTEKIYAIISKAIVQFNREDLLNMMNDNFFLSKQVCETSSKSGNLNIIQKAFNNLDDSGKNTLKSNSPLCTYASMSGNLNILKWLRSNNFQWNESTCYKAAYGGHLDVLQYLFENGCPFDARRFRNGIRRSKLMNDEQKEEMLLWIEHNSNYYADNSYYE